MMSRDETIVISVSIVTNKEDMAVRAVDALSRAATGIALEGLMVSISITRGEQEYVDGE